eukprot:6534969-Prymnesium_polylepis.5
MKQMKKIGDVSTCAARLLPCPFLTTHAVEAARAKVHGAVQRAPGDEHRHVHMYSIECAKKILYARTDTNKAQLDEVFGDSRLQNLLPKTMTVTMPHETIVHVALGRKNYEISTCMKIMGLEAMGDDFLDFQIIADAIDGLFIGYKDDAKMVKDDLMECAGDYTWR